MNNFPTRHEVVSKDATDVVMAWASGTEPTDDYLKQFVPMMDQSDTMWVLGNWLTYCVAAEHHGQQPDIRLFCVGLMSMDPEL